MVVTIDGPAGSGKSTLGELLAKRLGWLYFDTGVMYRALALASAEAAIAPDDAEQLASLADSLAIRVEPATIPDGRQYTIRLGQRDITWDLRRPEVERIVSQVASHPAVRAILRAQQRQIGLQGRVVMVGRDIGTVVMPDADLKIYLECSIEERARRRAAQAASQGHTVDLEQLQRDIARRDALDRHVMAPAQDALFLQADQLTPEQEVALILDHIETN